MLLDYPKPYINDTALAMILGGSEDRRYSWVKRALKKGELTRLKRGLYLIEKRRGRPIDNFEIAQQLNGPSYVSFESALSYAGWIPEAVFVTTSATTKRSSFVSTSIGTFNYERTPQEQFFMGVERIQRDDSIFLIATPWKALCDYYYVRRKSWENLAEVQEDLRIETFSLQSESRDALEEILEYYDSPRVRRFAGMLLEALS